MKTDERRLKTGVVSALICVRRRLLRFFHTFSLARLSNVALKTKHLPGHDRKGAVTLRLAAFLLLPALAGAASVGNPANPVTAVAFHPGGELVSGGYGAVMVWDAVNNKLERQIPGLIGRVHGLAFSKDGSRLAIAEGEPGKSGAIRLLDFASGNVIFTLDQQKDECYAVAYSPDGKLVAGGAQDGTVKIWNASDGKLVTRLKEQTGWITGIAFSPDGKLMAASSLDKTAEIWLTDGWKPLTQLPENPMSPVTAVAFSTDSTLLVMAMGNTDSADTERVIRIWRTEAADQPKNESAQQATRRMAMLHTTRAVDVGPGVPTGLAFSAPGVGSKVMRLLISLTDKTVRVLNQSGGWLSAMGGDTDWVYAVAVNADGSHIASGSGSGAVLLWNGTTGKLQATLK